jgi:signal transduction histidine kinase
MRHASPPALNAGLAENCPGRDNALSSGAPASHMLRGQLLGLLRLPVLVAGSLLLLVLVLLVGVAWRGVAKLEPIVGHQMHLQVLQDAMLFGQQALLDADAQAHPDLSGQLGTLRSQIDELVTLAQSRVEQTPNHLRRIEQALMDEAMPRRERLIEALISLRRVLVAEQEAHQRLLRDIERTARLELGLAASLALALPAAGFVAGKLLRRRVWKPLGNLADLLNELSVQDYRQIPEIALAEASPIVTPVFHNYNALVTRLRTLEAEHLRREHTLEQEVRTATTALLDLNRQLAQSERLAAVGAVSAGLAHELRNPLAGIRLACSRLRDAAEDTSQSERLALVITELDRLTALLNSQLALVKHAPEPSTDVALEECVEGLIALVRYQVPEWVRLETEIAHDLHCTLPVGQLRQALWNLVLNAAQAIGDRRGSITIAVVPEHDGIVLRVVDDGSGFSADELAAPARAFVTAREGGTGLGLAMVQRFARELGGSVELANRAPHGAIVKVTLPCECRRA